MKRLLSPGIAFLFALLCIPEFSTTIVAQGDNPIMVIRCRNFDGEALKDTKNTPNHSKMMGGCPDGYIATADGGCIPDCGVDFQFDPSTGYCDYIGMGSEVGFCPGSFPASICDPCLDDFSGSNSDNFLEYDSSLGACYKSCFDGVVTFDPPIVDCENPNADGLVTVELCFRSADPTMPLQDGQQVPITDISNCLNELGEEYISLLPAVISTTDDYGIGVAMDGEICIEFLADPNEPIIVNLSNQVEPLLIPIDCEVIPTMGQWSLLIFAMILSSIGLIFISKRRFA